MDQMHGLTPPGQAIAQLHDTAAAIEKKIIWIQKHLFYEAKHGSKEMIAKAN